MSFCGRFGGEVTLLVIGDGDCGLLEVGRAAAVSLPGLSALGQGAVGLFQCDLGILFPRAIRLFGKESGQQGAQGHVADQRHVAAAFEVREAEFGFADAEDVFDVPAGERDPQQSVQRCVGGAFGTKYFVTPVAGF